MTYTGEELERIFSVADLRWRAIIVLGLLSMRRAEVLNLTRSDLHFEKTPKYICVTAKHNGPKTWAWQIKNHNEAMVPLPEKIALSNMTIRPEIVLKQLIKTLPDEQSYICLTPAQYKNMMVRKAGGRLTFELRNNPGSNFTREFLGLLKRAMVPRKRFHDLRATFGTRMAEAGLALTEVQRLMRHSSPAITAAYYVSHDEAELAEKSNAVFGHFSGDNQSGQKASVA